MAGMIKGIFGLTPSEIKRERRKNLVSGYSDIINQAQARGDNALMTGGGMLLGTLLGKMATEKFGGIDTEMQEAEQRQANLQQLQERMKEGMTPQEYVDIGTTLAFSEDDASRTMGLQLMTYGYKLGESSKIEPTKGASPDGQDIKSAQDYLTNRLEPYITGRVGGDKKIKLEKDQPEEYMESGIDNALATEYNSLKAGYDDLLEAGQLSRAQYPTTETIYQQATDKLIGAGLISIEEDSGMFGILTSPKIKFNTAPTNQTTPQIQTADQELLDKYN